MINADRIRQAILIFLKRVWKNGGFNHLLIPAEIPSGDSYSYILIAEEALLNNACPLPPVAPVQGAKVVSYISGRGSPGKMIAVVMRPCEIRACIELAKLEQVNLDNILLISIDCPGVLPLSQYISDPRKGKNEFAKVMAEWGNDSVRPVCKTCLYSSEGTGDLHIGIMDNDRDICLVPNSDKAGALLKRLDIPEDTADEDWEQRIREIKKLRKENQKKADTGLKTEVTGLDNLSSTFSKCIGCYNCMRACPVCYCRVCYFNSDNVKHEAGDYLNRAIRKGSLGFPCDTLLFHSVRMSHMSLSCVGCGACEDVCPVSIPVAQVFNYIARENQKLFEYTPGMDKDTQIPLVVYREQEFNEFEDTH